MKNLALIVVLFVALAFGFISQAEAGTGQVVLIIACILLIIGGGSEEGKRKKAQAEYKKEQEEHNATKEELGFALNDRLKLKAKITDVISRADEAIAEKNGEIDLLTEQNGNLLDQVNGLMNNLHGLALEGQRSDEELTAANQKVEAAADALRKGVKALGVGTVVAVKALKGSARVQALNPDSEAVSSDDEVLGEAQG